MKNRTVIRIICMVLAAAVTFGVAPLVNRLTSDTTTVIRVSADVKQGSQITDAQVETAEVKADTLPTGVITQKAQVVVKYAASNGSKVAVSITIDTFAAGLSGKLQNGDIISVIVTDKDAGKTSIPAELKYVKVITTTTAGGATNE